MKRKAFGLIDLLIGLLIAIAIFMFSTSTFKNTSTLKINGSDEIKSVQQHVDDTVNEIENMKRQNIEYQKKLLNEEDY